ncbi:hypothetical protein PoMZ_07568 [Pyricularia oryzae]|uniref:Transmembrane protein n=1 Tax=Pyricularia oryzae TaxID=318829 RepID=A0A4P7NFF9_PYROR|nr:hypothetical protein PoMZ_07568 [Pyricularia oryzae]
MVIDTTTQQDPWPTNLESLGSPLDIITVTITPTEATTTITASPTPVIDSNAALISAQNDYIARRQEDGWKIAVIVVCTVGVFIMLTLFIVATRNQHRPDRNGSGEEGNSTTFFFGGRRSDKNRDDSTRRVPTPFQRRGRPEQATEGHKGWELKNLWSTKSSSYPNSGVILDLPPLAVRRSRGTTVLSDTDTISPLNPKQQQQQQQQHRGIQASTTASTGLTVIPSGTQTTIVAPFQDEDDSCTFRGASSPASAAKPAGMSTLAHDNFKDFVFRGATTTATDTAEDNKQDNDASLLADESLYNEQGFYVSPRNPRTQPAPSYQPRNPARVSPGVGDKRPDAAAGDFVFSNDELGQVQEPRAAKRARRSNEEHARGSTEVPQPRSQRSSGQQQVGTKSSIDADRASRASAGQSVRSQPSRAPTPCPGCLLPDRIAPHRHSADKDEHATIAASSSRPATATGLHAAQAEAPRPARHRMTLD